MKLQSIQLALFFLLVGLNVMAVNKTEKIKVNGSCDMCKKRIEKAATSLDGIETAQWDPETKDLSISYDDQKISAQQIQTAIAMTGHDTGLFSANDKRYAELPGCCRYERDDNRKVNSHALMEIQRSLKSKANKEECVHDKGPNSGSCCEQK
ncbi:heavy-metal-associated domain-containing protein [Sunxiuqinia dokdonensis]|uniref:HMA domain-containing protein n=1 Tax=Sunxiuqinia dokdonensis TaxID=1409788 RepID=A0A0L8V8N7_9BACT|nr:heavy-metal-associated domain-containing protein [Sunxiuqinia dokdonensis]KOH44809.1 hypothetical protein NC99_23560 [Sunxiuqinia dokdonensis]|tara:strand:+ start:1983 stop:2438 length:456 start_codon:yes stop_codon:yes gene_type:complete